MQGATPTSGRLVPIPTAWTSSGNYLAIPYGRVLQHFRTTTLSHPIHCATTTPHHSAITALHAIPGMQFVTGSGDATLRFWDALDGNCLRTVDFAKPIRAIVPIQDALICLTVSDLVLESISHSPETRIVIREQIRTNKSSCLASSHAASIIAFTNAERLNLTFGAKKPHKTTEVIFPNCLSAVAVSSDAVFLAVADVTGKIYLIKNIVSKVPPDFEHTTLNFHMLFPSVFHWHASAVPSLVFAHSDTVLLSAGNEGVLVTWSLTPASFGGRTFLPRLRAPVVALSVSPDETTYSISHEDNTVTLLEQGQGISAATIRALIAPTFSKTDFGPYVVCPTFPVGALYVSSGGHRIQIFDPIRGKHVDEFTIKPRNDVFHASDANEGNSPVTFRIKSIAAHRNGTLLATVDSTHEKIAVGKQIKSNRSSTLRIWTRKDTVDFWNLSAVFSEPHGDQNEVNSVEFHPELSVLITTGSDNKFRIWRAAKGQKVRPGGEQLHTWRCEVLRDYRGLTCKCAAFSSDGSLLAVGFQNIVTLWDIENNVDETEGSGEDIEFDSACSLNVNLIQTLVHAPLFDTIQNLKYCMCGVPLFVAVTERGIYLWNAVTHGIWWSFGVRCVPSTLTVDEKRGRFAVVVRVAGIVSNDNDLNVSLENVDGAGGTGETRPNNRKPRVSRRSSQHQSHRKEKSPRKRDSIKHSRKRGSVTEQECPVSNHHKTPGSNSCGDYAVAIFDAKTSIPTRVNQLLPGVRAAALEFVPTGTGKLRSSNLICIDSNSEVSIMKTDGDHIDELSFVSDEGFGARRGENNDEWENKNLDAMFGEHWKEEMLTVRANTDAIEVEYGNSEIERLLNKHFPGPIHTQAPTDVQAPNFMWDLLKLEAGRKRDGLQNRTGDDKVEGIRDVTELAVEEANFDKGLDKDCEGKDEMMVTENKEQKRDDSINDEIDFSEMYRICKQIVSESKAKIESS